MYRPPTEDPGQFAHKGTQPTSRISPGGGGGEERIVLVQFLFQPKSKDEIILIDNLRKEIERKTEEVDVEPEDIKFVFWESEEDGTEEDWKRIARQAIIEKQPFYTDCVTFVDRQSLQDQKVMRTQINPNDGSIEVVGRCPAAEATLNAAGVQVGSFELFEMLTQGEGSALLWQAP